MMEDFKIPPLAGYKEALEILGWKNTNRSMINTYMKRGKFPLPVQTLASGPVWTVSQIQRYGESIRRRPPSDSTIEKIRQSLTGRKLSEAERNNLREKRNSPEYSAKLSAKQRGELNNQAKLTQAIVDRIRNEYVPRVVTQQHLADKYKVHRSTVADIVNKRIWVD